MATLLDVFCPVILLIKICYCLSFCSFKIIFFFLVTFKENPESLVSCSLNIKYLFIFIFFCVGLNILHESKVSCFASEIPSGNKLDLFILYFMSFVSSTLYLYCYSFISPGYSLYELLKYIFFIFLLYSTVYNLLFSH